jgi:hypothetical protein
MTSAIEKLTKWASGSPTRSWKIHGHRAGTITVKLIEGAEMDYIQIPATASEMAIVADVELVIRQKAWRAVKFPDTPKVRPI